MKQHDRRRIEVYQQLQCTFDQLIIISHPSYTRKRVAVLIGSTQCCDLDQTQHGCRIDNGQCTCAFGCKSEFRYATRKECQDALKGRTSDICNRQPCQNGGTCTQVTTMPQYRCRCEGTGYWGNRCHRICPKPDQMQPGAKFPHECVLLYCEKD
uniref:EGF-like domain-containing protein n=1 Tax=Anopheles culicifacies TaxID=139723 RepID=A0A182MLM5_9DIPT